MAVLVSLRHPRVDRHRATCPTRPSCPVPSPTRPDTSQLTFRRMFESQVGNGPQQLWFEQEIPEPSRVNSNIRTFLIFRLSGRSVRVRYGRYGRCLVVVFGVIDEVVSCSRRWRESFTRKERLGISQSVSWIRTAGRCPSGMGLAPLDSLPPDMLKG